jgi:hypothetical protein
VTLSGSNRGERPQRSTRFAAFSEGGKIQEKQRYMLVCGAPCVEVKCPELTRTSAIGPQYFLRQAWLQRRRLTVGHLQRPGMRELG